MRNAACGLIFGFFLLGPAMLRGAPPASGTTVPVAEYSIQLDTPLQHDDGKFLWFHARAAAIPGAGHDGHPAIVMTLQKHLKVSDFYAGLHYMRSNDLGKSWSGPTLPPELDWKIGSDGVTTSVCDVTPGWHAASGRLIAIGVLVRYNKQGRQLLDKPGSHAAAYAVYDPQADSWSKWQTVDMPDPAGKFFLVTPGCGQWLVEPNGQILLPVYCRGPKNQPFWTTVLRCSFDGRTLKYIEHGNELQLDDARGVYEPSLVKFQDRYFLTLRNDHKGYVTTSDDGLQYAPIKPWTFDDGADLGSYNTQQHWLAHGEGLFLVYTRRGAKNDHVPRNRAPLFIAQVDPQKLQVLRATEKVAVPERGAALGNFGAAAITPDESWVTVNEGLWGAEARKRGGNGTLFISRILWGRP